jgi:archaellum component FlaC
LVAGVVAGALQCVQGCVQALSSGWSISKNKELSAKAQDSIEADTATANERIKLESAIAEKTTVAKELSSAKNNLSTVKATRPKDTKTIKELDETVTELEKKLKDANDHVDKVSKEFNRLSGISKNLSSDVDRLTNLERFKDQLRSNIIQAVKGAADIGVAFLRYQASETKLNADKVEAAKNMTDRSANAMSEEKRPKM